MKRIASLSILFAALIEFAIEHARFDLWIVAVLAVVALLWKVLERALRSHMDSQKRDNRASVSR
jgi:apolipoprotein N-acyltransferase